MRQRVAIARALALDPQILLIDERFAELDVQTKELLKDLQEELQLARNISYAFKVREQRFDATDAILFMAVFVCAWQPVSRIGMWPKVLMPAPATVAATVSNLVVDSSLTVGIGVTMSRLAAVPFSILLIGFNDFGILFVVVMASVFSVMISTYSGIRNIPPIYTRAARNMGANGFVLFRHVMIPAATPTLINGLRQTWSFAWHALTGIEILITTLYGLGHVLYVGREFQDMSGDNCSNDNDLCNRATL